jgi:hypothetical protein
MERDGAKDFAHRDNTAMPKILLKSNPRVVSSRRELYFDYWLNVLKCFWSDDSERWI